jgi:Family of unknown function (DUF5684)
MLFSLSSQSSSGAGPISTTVWLLGLVWLVLVVIGFWKVFAKAGQPGWAAIIPIYNVLVMLRVVGRPWWWVLLWLFVPIVGWVVYIILMLNLAKSFGRGVGFGILLFLFPAIWGLILGFGSSQYVGPAAGPNAVAPAA